MSRVTVPPILATLIGRLAAAVPGRARATFTDYWLLERGRWSWLAVWRALLGVLEGLFAPPVWHVVIDDTVVERISAGAPGSLIHRNHSAKPNRPRFLRGQGWLCLAAVVERGWRVGAVPLMLRAWSAAAPTAASSRAPASCCACSGGGSAGCGSCSTPGSCAPG